MRHFKAEPIQNRNLLIVFSVIVIHAIFFCVVQTELMRYSTKALIPDAIQVEIILAQELTHPKQILELATSKPTTLAASTPPMEAQDSRSDRSGIARSPITTETPTSAIEETFLADRTIKANVSNIPAIASALPTVELPSSKPDYLKNPEPAYPTLSRRLEEQGKVVVRVFVDVEGRASQARVLISSGFERLDSAALNTVLKWRYVPGKRDGMPEPMWLDIPITWVLS